MAKEKPTKTKTRQLAEELLSIQPIYKRYQQAEKELKVNMVALQMDKIEIGARGRVFISQSESTSYDPALARSILGVELAGKVIEVKESVKNALVDALVKTGDILPEQYEQLEAGADKSPRVSLYVRPLD